MPIVTIGSHHIQTSDVMYVATEPTWSDRYDERIDGYDDINIYFIDGTTLETATNQLDVDLNRLAQYPLVRTGNSIINIHRIRQVNTRPAYNERYDERIDDLYTLTVRFRHGPTIRIDTSNPNGFTVPDSSDADDEARSSSDSDSDSDRDDGDTSTNPPSEDSIINDDEW